MAEPPVPPGAPLPCVIVTPDTLPCNACAASATGAAVISFEVIEEILVEIPRLALVPYPTTTTSSKILVSSIKTISRLIDLPTTNCCVL